MQEQSFKMRNPIAKFTVLLIILTSTNTAIRASNSTATNTSMTTSSPTSTSTMETSTQMQCENLENKTGVIVVVPATTVGAKATYKCSDGYLKTVGDLERTCGSDGNWNGTAPTCLLVCENLENKTGVIVEVPATTVGAKATYKCSDGYLKTVGDLERTCGSDGKWNGTAPTCLIDCGNLENKTSVIVEVPTTTVGAKATYKCSDGYLKTVGDLERTCGSDGNWNGTAPTCLLVCENLENKTGVIVEVPATTVGAKATYKCSDGYLKTVGDLERTCGSDGKWNGTAPTCLIDCGNLENKTSVIVEVPTTTVGAKATYKCSDGYLKTVGDLERTCGSDGNWNGTAPTCLLVCENLENKTGVIVEVPATTVGAKATYKCSDGYLKTVGDLERTCGSDGNWNGTAPTCLLVCEYLENKTGVIVEVPATTVGAKATYKCSDGYLKTVGDLERTCGSDGKWNGTAPTCLLDCGNLENKTSVIVEVPATTVGAKATYKCSDGYLKTVGDLERTCGSDGKWNGTAPTCLLECEHLENKTGVIVEVPATTVGAKATYKCSDGYLKTVGDLERTCGSDGKWNGTAPTCLLDCGILENKTGVIVEVPATTVGAKATYKCSDGYLKTAGDSERTCGSDGKWNGLAPTCLRKKYLNETCSDQDFCIVNNTFCKDAQCQCIKALFPKDGECVPLLDVRISKFYFNGSYATHSNYIVVQWYYVKQEVTGLFDTYVVEATPEGINNTVMYFHFPMASLSPGLPTQNISGLSPGTNYSITFYVTKNSVPSANRTTTSAHTLPSSLTKGNITSVTEHSMTLTWVDEDPPSYTSYEIHVSPNDVQSSDSCFNTTTGKCILEQTRNRSSLKLHELAPGTLYTVDIYTSIDGFRSECPLNMHTFTVPVLPADIYVPLVDVTNNSFIVKINDTEPGYETLTIDVVKEGQNISVFSKTFNSSERDIKVFGPPVISGSKYNVVIFTSVPKRKSANSTEIVVYTRPTTPSMVAIPEAHVYTENFRVTFQTEDTNFDHFELRVCNDSETTCPFSANFSADKLEKEATGLSSGTVYNVTVYTVLQTGLHSKPKTATRSTRPTHPYSVTVLDVHETNATIDISTSDDRYDNFNVSFCPEDRTCTETNNTSNIIEIVDLDPATFYNISVYTVSGELQSRNFAFTNFYTSPETITSGSLKNVDLHSMVVDLSNVNSTFEQVVVNYTKEEQLLSLSISSTDKEGTVTNLTAGTKYTFHVFAYFQGRYSDMSQQLESYTKPEEITDLIVSGTTRDSMTVSWESPTIGDVDKYVLLLTCLGPNKQSKIVHNETEIVHTTQSYTMYGLVAGTVCNASVTTKVGKQTGYPKLSALTNATDEKGPSAIDSIISTNITSRSIEITWNKPSIRNGFITKYEVNASLGDTVHSAILNCDECPLTTDIKDLQKLVTDCSSALKCEGALSSDSLHHTFTGLHPFRRYSISVRAFTSEPGNIQTNTSDTNEDVPAGPPENLTPTSSAKEISLQWDPPPVGLRNGIITYYTVHYKFLNKTCYNSVKANYVSIEVTSDKNRTQLPLKDLVPFTDYEIKIRANTSIGSGNYSESTSVLTSQSVPDNIDSNKVKVDVTNSSARISWETPCITNGIIKNYTLMVHNTDDNTTLPVKTTQTNKTFDELTDLKPYSNYTIKITGHTVVGGRNDATGINFNTTIGEPKVPTEVKITTKSSTELAVEWKIPYLYTGPTSYNVTAIGKFDPRPPETVYGFKSNNCIIPRLQEYWNYTITVTAITGKGEAKSKSEIGHTDESVPLEVDTFNLYPELNVTLTRSIAVDWTPPTEINKNGIIVKYLLEYSSVSISNKTIELSATTTNYTIKDIKPGNYTISVSAATSKGKGNVSEKSISLSPGAPLKAQESVENPLMRVASRQNSDKKHEITVELPSDILLCNDTNGSPVEWGIVVAEDNKATDAPFNGNRSDFEKKKKDVYETWSDVKDKDSMTPYIPTPMDWNPCVTGNGARRKRSTKHFVQTYTVGTDGDCSGRCNGALKSGSLFSVKSYVCTSTGCTETLYSAPIATDPDPTIPIVAGTSSAIVVLIVVGVVVFILRRKQIACFSKDVESTTTHRTGNDINLDKIEPSKPHAFSPGSIKLADFPDAVEKMHRDSDLLFADAYKLLKEKSPNHQMTAAEQQCCRPKNRYTNILAFDHSRVKLRPSDDIEGSDYINANYIPGYTSKREYVATQGPMQATFDDFWRMVWEQNVDTIVMLTKLMEKGRRKCDKYWPDLGEPVFYGDLVVSLQSESNLSDYTIKIFEVKMGTKMKKIKHFHFLQWPDFGCPDRHWPVINFVSMVRQYRPPFPQGPLLKEERKMVRQFSYLKWPDMGCPDTPELLIEFVKAVRQYSNREQRQPAGPKIVHCSAGVGRTGTFIAVDYLLQHIRDHDEVDIFSLVLDMRNHRLNMVQTEDQYVYIHECLKAFITTDEEEEDEEDEEPVYMNTGQQDENVYENTAFQKD